MAGENLGYIFSALSQILQPELHRQWNRTTVLLGELSAVAGAVSEGAGKNTQFAAEFSGATAQTVAEGSDIQASEYNSDLDVPATAPWCTYRSSFQLSEQEIDAARGATGSPDELRNLFGPRMLSSAAVIARAIETDALTGTGVDVNGNPTLVGIFGGALSASGNYLGLNPAAYPEWAGNVTSNGGITRTLTPDLLDTVDQNIFTSSSEPWNLIMTTAGVVRKYGGFFTNSGASGLGAPLIRMNDMAGAPVYGIGVPLDGQSQQNALYYKGQKVLRNAVAPAGKLALLNTNHIKIKYLPKFRDQRELEFFDKIGLKGQSGSIGPVQATNIPARVTVIAKTGDSVKVSLRVTVAMAIVRRNAMGLLQDISEV
jgi:hypothetical protein